MVTQVCGTILARNKAKVSNTVQMAAYMKATGQQTNPKAGVASSGLTKTSTKVNLTMVQPLGSEKSPIPAARRTWGTGSQTSNKAKGNKNGLRSRLVTKVASRMANVMATANTLGKVLPYLFRKALTTQATLRTTKLAAKAHTSGLTGADMRESGKMIAWTDRVSLVGHSRMGGSTWVGMLGISLRGGEFTCFQMG